MGCGRVLASGEYPVVTNGRVLCGDCALLEGSTPAPAHIAKRRFESAPGMGRMFHFLRPGHRTRVPRSASRARPSGPLRKFFILSGMVIAAPILFNLLCIPIIAWMGMEGGVVASIVVTILIYAGAIAGGGRYALRIIVISIALLRVGIYIFAGPLRAPIDLAGLMGRWNPFIFTSRTEGGMLGSVHVQVVKYGISRLALVSPGDQITYSASPLCVFVIKLRNDSTHAVNYSSWRTSTLRLEIHGQLVPRFQNSRTHLIAHGADVAFVRDSSGRSLVVTGDASTTPFLGFSWWHATIPAGRAVYDIIAFYPPHHPTRHLYLYLPGKNLGISGGLHIKLRTPPSLVLTQAYYAALNRKSVRGIGRDGRQHSSRIAGRQGNFNPPHGPGTIPGGDAPSVSPHQALAERPSRGSMILPTVHPSSATPSVAFLPPTPTAIPVPGAVFTLTGNDQSRPVPLHITSVVQRWQIRPVHRQIARHAESYFGFTARGAARLIYASPQAYMMAWQTDFHGKYLHIHTIDLRNGRHRLAVVLPEGTIQSAVLSPHAEDLACIWRPWSVAHGGLPAATLPPIELGVWSCSQNRRLWRQRFGITCPYSIVGFARRTLLVCRRRPGKPGLRVYRVGVADGKVLSHWTIAAPLAPNELRLCPGGKFLAAFFQNRLQVWSTLTGKCVGEVRVSLPNDINGDGDEVAFSPDASHIAASVGRIGENPRILLLFDFTTGRLISAVRFQATDPLPAGIPLSHAFACLSGSDRWQVGLDLIDPLTGSAYYRFLNPLTRGTDLEPESAHLTMLDDTHLLVAAQSGNGCGVSVLSLNTALASKGLNAVRRNLSRSEWRFGKVDSVRVATAKTIMLPTTPQEHWSIQIREPTGMADTVPDRIIQTRLLTGPQGGPGRSLHIDKLCFATEAPIALIAYRQILVGTEKSSAYWIDRINTQSGQIMGSFNCSVVSSQLLNIGPHGRRMIMCTRDTLDIYRWPRAGPPLRISVWHMPRAASGSGFVGYAAFLAHHRLVTAAPSHVITIWSLRAAAALYRFIPAATTTPTVDRSDQLLAFGTLQGIYIVNFASGRVMGPLGTNEVGGRLQFSPGGRYLAQAAWNNTVKLWDLRRGLFLGHIAPAALDIKSGKKYLFPWAGPPLHWLDDHLLEIHGMVLDCEHDCYIGWLTMRSNYPASQSAGGMTDRLWSIQPAGNHWQMVGVRLPDPRLERLDRRAIAHAQTYLAPGAAITVRLKHGGLMGLGHRFIRAAERSLRLGDFKISADSSYILNISGRLVESQNVAYQQTHGSFPVFHPRQHQNKSIIYIHTVGRKVKWVLTRRGKVIWSTSEFVIPAVPTAVFGPHAQNLQAYVDHLNLKDLKTAAQTPLKLPNRILSLPHPGVHRAIVIGPGGLMGSTTSGLALPRLSGHLPNGR